MWCALPPASHPVPRTYDLSPLAVKQTANQSPLSSRRIDQIEFPRTGLTLGDHLTPMLASRLLAQAVTELPHHFPHALVVAHHPLGGLHRVSAPIRQALDKIRRQIDRHRFDVDVDVRRFNLRRRHVDAIPVLRAHASNSGPRP